MNEDSLQAEHATGTELTNLLTDVAENLSINFDQWDEQYVSGPSLYFVIVADVDLGQYADPLGNNRWPVDIARIATESRDAFVEAAREVAFKRDGAVIITTDGTIQEQMVRIRSPSTDEVKGREEINYADWMGTKHLSAVEISVREEVLAAVTISEENGRVSVFRDGDFTDYERDELGGRWRTDE
ncbi:MAG: diadenylate cyclase [Halobacteriales archaeon]|nr:diadenylate cyclase [Halobacteriales archaeon]